MSYIKIIFCGLSLNARPASLQLVRIFLKGVSRTFCIKLVSNIGIYPTFYFSSFATEVLKITLHALFI